MKNDILNFLKKNHIAAIATVKKNHKPQVAVILYAIDDDMNIYFVTHQTAEKACNLKENKAISLAIWSSKELSLQIEGETEELTKKEDQKKALEYLANSASEEKDFYPPIFRMGNQDYAIYKIKITRCRYANLEEEHINESSPILHELTL